jgi:formylglycine-generating enzyme required for sulfatase activity
VSWNDVCGDKNRTGGFLGKVNSDVTSDERFHLPTEAQWEYACRAGMTGPYAGNLDQMAWFGDNSWGKTHPVGGKQANAWGLHDMHGNVWEWCSDWVGEYADGFLIDPTGAASGTYRVCRGGSWYSDAGYCRVAYRYSYYPALTTYYIGFRVARRSVP